MVREPLPITDYPWVFHSANLQAANLQPANLQPSLTFNQPNLQPPIPLCALPIPLLRVSDQPPTSQPSTR
ncbi:hypothetical protein LYNGBM3L_59860 [Moorena producens 3L]|uniref:Pentapeptide repeat-containing protein n=1 Tax=Moorena producens 3L TaxID=489825 RepID=F4Y051_9CYAN|nr:hypothetical protein LYNGBM3L_59860 [Moorena producens 3L]OLT66893.1 hypothetical protein BI334_19445 [Moorena producens 3L]